MIEHEKAVIGAILEDVNKCEQVISILKPEHFTDNIQRGLYEIILEFRKDNSPIDFTLVSTEAKRKGLLNDSFGKYDQSITMDIIESKERCIPHHWKGYLNGIDKTYKENKLKEMASQLAESIEKGEDATKTLSDTKNKLEDLSQEIRIHKPRDLCLILDEYYGNYDDIDHKRIATGFKFLDAKLDGGFKRKEFVVLGARPGMGKSAFAINMCVNMASNGMSTAFVSLEMDETEVVGRIANSEEGINIEDLVDVDNIRKFGTLQARMSKQKKIFINDETNLDISDIESYVAGIKKDSGLDILFVDHIHLVSTKLGKGVYEKMRHISRELKKIAKKYDILVVALCQLGRDIEKRTDKEPQLSDIKESGSIEQDADKVLMMMRPGYYDTDKPKHICHIYIKKARNGHMGETTLHFNGDRMLFTTPIINL